MFYGSLTLLLRLLLMHEVFMVSADGKDSRDCLRSLTRFLESEVLYYYQSFVIYEDFRHYPVAILRANRYLCPGIAAMMVDRFVRRNHALYQLPSMEFYRTSRAKFFVISANTSYVESVFDNLNEKMWSAHCPKILLISWGVTGFEKILEYAWTKQFLDVTLLQINFNDTSNKLEFQLNFSTTMIVKQYNPFTNTYDTHECSTKTNWFPDKLKNLHGYKLWITLVQHPPFSFIKRNSSGHIVDIIGTEANILKYLAKGLNFEPKIFEDSSYARIYFEDLDADQLLSQLRTGKVDLIANDRVYRPRPENETDYEYTFPVYVDDFCHVVPIIRIKQTSIQSHILIAVFFIIFVSFIDMFMACCCAFDRRFWNFTRMVEMLLGVSVSEQPYRPAERIIFFSLAIFAMVYSQNVLSELTKMELNELMEVDFKELKDVLKHQLTPQADYSVIPNDPLLEVLDDLGNIHQIRIQQWSSRKRCLKMLAEFQNVTCLMGRTVGEYSVFSGTITHGKPVMKIMSNSLWAASTRMVLKKGSPYLHKVNILIHIARYSGIVKRSVKSDLSDLKLRQEIIKNTKINENKNKLIEPEGSGKRIMLKIISIGLCVSTIVFFLEVISSRLSIFRVVRHLFV